MFLVAHEAFHYLRKTRQVAGRHGEIEADAFILKLLEQYRGGSNAAVTPSRMSQSRPDLWARAHRSHLPGLRRPLPAEGSLDQGLNLRMPVWARRLDRTLEAAYSLPHASGSCRYCHHSTERRASAGTARVAPGRALGHH